MRDDLVAVEIEVDPFGRGTAFRTAQQSAVESAGLVQAGDGKGKMERHDRHGVDTDNSTVAVYTRKTAAQKTVSRPPLRCLGGVSLGVP